MEEYRILLIEDDEVARKQLAKIIKKEGFDILIAEDGNVGLEIFKKELPEIVITDLKMPGVDGIEVMHTIKRMSPNVQIILVTAYGEAETAIYALREGALDYIKKPIDLNLLLLALGRAKEKLSVIKKVLAFPSIMLVEDEEVTRNRLGRILSKEGWKVTQISNGEDATKYFNHNKVDIVLIDIKMPKKDGLQTLKELRNISTDFESIVLTGYGDEVNAIQAMRIGAINFLKKPIDLDQMIIAVEKAIDKLNTERSLKYRIRELELAEQIIAKITSEKEILVDVSRYTHIDLKDFAERLLDLVQQAMIIFDENMKIIFVNRYLKEVCEEIPEKLDQRFIDSLQRIGIRDITKENLQATIDRIVKSPMGNVEIIGTGKYSYLTLLNITLLGKDSKQKVVLMTARGERTAH